MTDLTALLSEAKRLAAKDRPIGSAAMTRLAELAVVLADALEDAIDEPPLTEPERLRNAEEEREKYYVKARVYGAIARNHTVALEQIARGTARPAEVAREALAWRHSERNGVPMSAVEAMGEALNALDERDMALSNLETAMAERAELRSALAAAKPDLNTLLRDAYIDAKLGPRDRYTCDDATFRGMVASAGAEWDGLCADERCEAMFEIGKVLNDSPASVSQVELTIEAMKADMVMLQRDLATERGKRCGSCRHWGIGTLGHIDPETLPERVCVRVERRAYVSGTTDGNSAEFNPHADFGCVEWEAKG